MTIPTNALGDGWDADRRDPTASPVRGNHYKLNGPAYTNRGSRVDLSGKAFGVVGKQSGYQKLAKGCAPVFLMQQPGEPKPERPHVDENEWPKNLNGQHEHPYKWTTFMHLMDVETGEASTFSTNTVGGNIALGELSDQISLMRQIRPDAIPVIALESCEMPTSFGGTKPRPLFRILGWRSRSDLASPAAAALPAPRSTVELQRDNYEAPAVESPPWDDAVPSFEPETPSPTPVVAKAKNGKRS